MERQSRRVVPESGCSRIHTDSIPSQQQVRMSSNAVGSQRSGPSSGCGVWRVWLRICHSWNRMFERAFYQLGFQMALRPWLPLLVVLLLSGGFIWKIKDVELESRTERLFTPQDSRAFKDIDAGSKHFSVKIRPSNFILTRKDGGNLLERNAILAGLVVHREVMAKTRFDTVCLRRSSPPTNVTEKKCHMLTPTELFRYNPANIGNVTDQLTAIYRNPLFYMANGEPAFNNFRELFGRDIVIVNNTVISSKVLNFQYASIFHLDKKGSKLNKAWEEAFVDVVRNIQPTVENMGYVMDYFTPHSVDESTSNSTSADIKYASVSFALMVTLTTVFFTRPWMPYHSHGFLAIGGVALIALALAIAVGFCICVGITFVSIVGVLPFVVVGVAIDDMFVILGTLDRTEAHLPVPQRIATAMSRCGATITMTTLTDIFAFALSTTSRFPAIRYFCAYGLIALLLAYFFLITCFVGFMAYDVKRINASRFDVLCCFKQRREIFNNEKPEAEKKPIASKLMHGFGVLLMKTPVRIGVVLLSLGLLGVGIYGTTQISQNFELRMLGEDDSYYIKYLEKEDALLDQSEAINVITTSDIDYSQESVQQSLLKIATMMADDPLYSKNAISWITAFRQWAAQRSLNTTGANFLPMLFGFLREPINTRYGKDLDFKLINDTIPVRLIAQRVRLFLKGGLTSIQQADGMEHVRERADTLLPFKSYPITYYFIYFEQFATTLQQTLLGLGICGGVIAVVTALYVVHPGVVVILICSFAGLIVELFGLMAAWDVNLNSISMICLVMAIGFAVDYSAHVAHAYVVSEKDTPEERVIDALSTIGSSVFMGGFSTGVGVAALGFASSEIFRIFFKMFLGIVVLGLLNGLVINPVYMSILCRAPVATEFNSYDCDQPQNGIELPEKKSNGYPVTA